MAACRPNQGDYPGVNTSKRNPRWPRQAGSLGKLRSGGGSFVPICAALLVFTIMGGASVSVNAKALAGRPLVPIYEFIGSGDITKFRNMRIAEHISVPDYSKPAIEGPFIRS